MDAVIFNLDMYPEVSRPVTDYAYAAIHIKNRQLKVVNGETLKKLYREYCKYPAMDYSMEEQITELSGFYFRFERGTEKCKV